MQFMRVMFLVTLGVCAISLQGCGSAKKESLESPSQEKAAEAAAAVEAPKKKDISKEFAEKGGCTALYATVPLDPPGIAVKTIKAAVQVKLLAALTAQGRRQGNFDLLNDETEKDFVFEVVDQILFYAESKDPFKTWVASNEFGRGSSYGTMDINSILKEPASGAVRYFQTMLALQQRAQKHGTLGSVLDEWIPKTITSTIDGQCKSYKTARRLDSSILV